MRVTGLSALSLLLISCGGGSSDGTTGTGTGAITGVYDGAWKVSMLSGEKTGAGSEIRVTNDTATGAIVKETEGMSIGGCQYEKARIEVDLTFAGNDLTGKVSYVYKITGCSTAFDDTYVIPVKGTRTNAGGAADGDWEIALVADKTACAPYCAEDVLFLVNVTGQTAKAWSKSERAAGAAPPLNATRNGNSANGTGRSDLTFTASQ